MGANVLKLLRTNKNYNYYLGVSEIFGVVVNQAIYYLVIPLLIYLFIYLFTYLFIYLFTTVVGLSEESKFGFLANLRFVFCFTCVFIEQLVCIINRDVH